MKTYTLEDINKLASSFSVEQINSFTDEEIFNLSMERPGHPGQRGFMLQPRYFKSQKHFSEITHALMKRLTKAEDRKVKEKTEENNNGKVVHFSGDEYLKINSIIRPLLDIGRSEEQPQFVILMGGVGSGKTTVRRQRYNTDYVNFDFGEIFNILKKEFGTDNSKLTGYTSMASDLILQESLKSKKNIVVEIIGDRKDVIDPVINGMTILGYKASVQFVSCDPAEAYNRHLKAVKEDNSYFSAFHTQEVTLSFFYHHLKLGKMPTSTSN